MSQCPQLKKEDWHLKEFNWENQAFYKVHYSCFFNMPINLKSVTQKAAKMLKKRDLLEKMPVIFSVNEGPFGGDILMSIKKHVDDLETRTLSGHFISFLYTGSYSNQPKLIEKIMEYGKKQHLNFADLFIWHVTCPKCVQKYKNAQTVIFAKVV